MFIRSFLGETCFVFRKAKEISISDRSSFDGKTRVSSTVIGAPYNGNQPYRIYVRRINGTTTSTAV